MYPVLCVNYISIKLGKKGILSTFSKDSNLEENDLCKQIQVSYKIHKKWRKIRCRGSISKTIINTRLGSLTEPGAGRVVKRKETDKIFRRKHVQSLAADEGLLKNEEKWRFPASSLG